MMWNFNHNSIFIWGFLLLVTIAILVANDANTTGRNGLLWGLVTLVMPVMGLIIYLVVRSLPPPVVVATPQAAYATTPVQSAQYRPIPQTGIDITEKDVQFCTSCGASNKVAAKFCNVCGQQILQE